MFDIHSLIQEIDDFLQNTHNKVDIWFDKTESVRRFVPENKGWSIEQILEHIVLTNHFLLIIIEKGAGKALRNIEQKDLVTELVDYHFHKEGLEEIGIHKSFAWIRPQHMEPTGEKSLAEIRHELQAQCQKCREYLQKLANGEGILYKTTMSVNQLGKIDVYEYIYFLAKHIERHIQQMQKNEAELSRRLPQMKADVADV